MGLFTNLKENNYASHLQKYLSTHNIKRTSITWDEAKSIGILFNAHNTSVDTEILDFIKKTKKNGFKIKALAIVDKKMETSSLIFDTINSKNISWSKVPDLDVIHDFQTTPFDILLNFYDVNCKPLEFISMTSHAKMRIGLHGTNLECSDLIVGDGNGTSFNELIATAKTILSRMAVGA